MTSIVPKSLALIAGVIFVLAMTLVGIFAPLLAPHDPAEISMFERNIPPGESIKHPLGTDLFGRDMLSRLIHSLRIPVILGGAALLLGTVSSLVLIGLGARSRVFKNTGQLPSEGFLNHSLLRVAGPVFLIGPFLGLFVLAILGSGLLQHCGPGSSSFRRPSPVVTDFLVGQKPVSLTRKQHGRKHTLAPGANRFS